MINTTKIPEGSGASLSKTLFPGNQKVKINSLILEKLPFDEEQYKLVLNCEGEDLGSSFEGFFLDRENESLGRHKGAVGRVRASKWNYKDKTFDDGGQIFKDDEILISLKQICKAAKCDQWLTDANGKYETIEELILGLNEAAPFKGIFFNACLSAKEYNNKQGYTNYDLFIGKGSKTVVHIESLDVKDEDSKLHKYSEVEDLQRRKETPPALTEFSVNDDDDDLAF